MPRFLIGTWSLQWLGPGFPWGTFAIKTYLLSRGALSAQSLWYGLGGVVAGVAAVLLGILLARAVFS